MFIPICSSITFYIGCALSHVQHFAAPWTAVCQVPLPMESSRQEQQEYWSGVSFPTPGDLPDPGIKPTSRVSCIVIQILYH